MDSTLLWGAACVGASFALRLAVEPTMTTTTTTLSSSNANVTASTKTSSTKAASSVSGAGKGANTNAPTSAATSTQDAATSSSSASERQDDRPVRSIRVVYATQTGQCRRWATRVKEDLERFLVPAVETEAARRPRGSAERAAVPRLEIQVLDLADYDAEELVFEDCFVAVVSTYEGGTPPPNAKAFFDSLQETANDFRVHKSFLTNFKYSILGLGDSVYEDRWNACAKSLDMLFKCLSAKRVADVCLADTGAGSEVDTVYKEWLPQLISGLKRALVPRARRAGNATKSSSASAAAETEAPEFESDDEGEKGSEVQDLEDLAGPSKNDDNDDELDADPNSTEPRAMVTPTLDAALTKQGYRIIGSHSGVKLCRWTKAMMRGRGGCYKHTFYGIQSHQCMEMTPSLACANKCVFCWRHHSNPVGREWRWKTDEPEFLITGAIESHQAMVKQLKGVPGVLPERLAEGMNVQHCALSLVGEPIMYPFINQFVELLHERKISSFMVTNAQFPEQMRQLRPVTQMYISVDASNKTALKAVDRPVFDNFWERFLDSIDALRENKQRTVFRMTLIHGWNDDQDKVENNSKKEDVTARTRKPVPQSEEQRERGAKIIHEYAELAQRGDPCFIEIKGVTFCGTSDASSLTMKNVPFHEEVVEFARRMCADPALEGRYGVACVHEHSCCVLIARRDPFFNNEEQRWYTWIDYPKFQQLAAANEPFSAVDYMAPTPSWALDGSPEAGFDPNETRFRRKQPYQGPGC